MTFNLSIIYVNVDYGDICGVYFHFDVDNFNLFLLINFFLTADVDSGSSVFPPSPHFRPYDLNTQFQFIMNEWNLWNERARQQ